MKRSNERVLKREIFYHGNVSSSFVIPVYPSSMFARSFVHRCKANESHVDGAVVIVYCDHYHITTPKNCITWNFATAN